MRIYLFIIVVFIGSLGLHAQNTTREPSKKNEAESATLHKVMLIPFEPKLYLSEIDRSIHLETNLTAREIKNKFRDGINEQLYKTLKTNKYGVVDLMDDTLKYKKDLNGLYQYLSYDYLPVPDQSKYTPPQKEKSEKKIDKGQLTVETNSEKRFMEARINNPKVVPMLYGKYKTDIFVFINQLDIFASGSKDALDLGPENQNRRIVLHYTVYTYDAKKINSGIVEEEFDPLLNNPKKIIDKHFNKIASTLVSRINKALTIAAK